MKTSVRIRVCGVVQGVNFRFSTRAKAQELGVHGMVRNESDGSVYIEAEGEADQVQKLALWCKTGPARAKVESVVVEEIGSKGVREFVVVSSKF